METPREDAEAAEPAATIGLRALNQNPSKAVAQVRETNMPLVITDRGKPVARLVPEPTQPESSTRFLQELVARGEVRPPIRPFKPWVPETLPDPAPGVESLSDLVIADRDKERNRR